MAARWTIVNQRQEDRLTPAGTFETVMVVSYTVYDTNTTHSVEVPLNRYRADYVRDLVDGQVDTILEVHNL